MRASPGQDRGKSGVYLGRIGVIPEAIGIIHHIRREYPPPAINAFIARPSELVYGEGSQTALSWDVTTYMPDTEIEISILGSAPVAAGLDPKGTITVPVADTTVFMLSASYEERVSTLQTMVSFLEPTPTPTPPPSLVAIEHFVVEPEVIVPGGSNQVQLSWSVGEGTVYINEFVARPIFELDKTYAVPNEGSVLLTVRETTAYVLVVYDALGRRAERVTQVTVLDASQAAAECLYPNVHVLEPTRDQVIDQGIQVKGTATKENFDRYEFKFRTRAFADEWHWVQTFNTPIEDGDLGWWQTSQLPNGDYDFLVIVIDKSGNSQECIVPVTIKH